MSYAAFFAIYGNRQSIPDGPIQLKLSVASQTVELSEVFLEHDTDLWLVLGVAALQEHRVLMDFQDGVIVINGDAISFV